MLKLNAIYSKFSNYLDNITEELKLMISVFLLKFMILLLNIKNSKLIIIGKKL
jgi:hypothetical protein